MNFYITTFFNVRYLKANFIPVSTCLSDPAWFHDNKGKNYFFVDKNNVFNGIREPLLSPASLKLTETCQKDCPWHDKLPDCQFLTEYKKYLKTLNFDSILETFKKAADDVRKITKYKDEPNIVLLVYEAEHNPCSERAGLIELFSYHGIELKEFKKDLFCEQNYAEQDIEELIF